MEGQKKAKPKVLGVLSILKFERIHIIYEVGVNTCLSGCVCMCVYRCAWQLSSPSVSDTLKNKWFVVVGDNFHDKSELKNSKSWKIEKWRFDHEGVLEKFSDWNLGKKNWSTSKIFIFSTDFVFDNF